MGYSHSGWPGIFDAIEPDELNDIGFRGVALLQKTIWENPYIPHMPFRQQRKFLSYEGLEALYGGAAGGGKALAAGSGVLTPTGYVPIEDVKIGMVISNPDGGVARVTGYYPQGTQAVYNVHFSDGSIVRCTRDHLWAINFGSESRNYVTDTANLYNLIHYRHVYVPTSGVMMFNEGDGVGEGDKCYSDRIENVSRYLHASRSARYAFAQGVMDRHGVVHNDDYHPYVSIDVPEDYVEQMKFLFQSLGCVVYSKNAHLEIHSPRASMLFRRRRDDGDVRSLNASGEKMLPTMRRVVDISYGGHNECVCIGVDHPNGLFITDNFTVTHNSDCLLMAALQFVNIPGYSALLLRRTYSDLALPGALMDRAFQWLDSTDAKWSETNKVWTFPSGATLTFGYLETDRDKYRYQSSEFQFIGFDELTQFTSEQYTYMFSRLRRLKHIPVPLRMRAATNPGGVGHEWVMERFPVNREPRENDPMFVPARVTDNAYIDQENYISALNCLDYVTREQLLNGRWDVSVTGGVFTTDPVTVKVDDIDLSKCTVYGACDPSEGGEDYASIVTIVELPDTRWLVYACDMSRDIQSTTIDKIITYHTLYRYDTFWIEANSLGHAKSAVGESLFEAELKKRQAHRNVYVPYRFVWNTQKKADRIRALEPFYSSGQLVFVDDYKHRYPELIQQFKAFPNGNHDDGPDAVSTLVSQLISLRARMNNRVVKPVIIPSTAWWGTGMTSFGSFASGSTRWY